MIEVSFLTKRQEMIHDTYDTPEPRIEWIEDGEKVKEFKNAEELDLAVKHQDDRCILM